MDFFSCHLGHWFTKIFFEVVIKPKFDLGSPDEKGVEEATKFVHSQLRMLNKHLEESEWLANDAFSIADLFAFAYVEQHRQVDVSLDDYTNVKAWFERVESRPSIARARARLSQ